MGRMASSFSSLLRRSRWWLRTTCRANPFVSVETLEACALIGQHLLAAGNDAGFRGSQSLELGDVWNYSCPRSPDWDGDVESWTASEGTSLSEQCEDNVESLALSVMTQDQSGEKISLFLGNWELEKVDLSCHIVLDMLGQEVYVAWWLDCCCQEALCHSKKGLSLTVDGL